MKKMQNNNLALHKNLVYPAGMISAQNLQEADRLTREVESVDKSIDGLVYELSPEGDDIWVDG